MLTEENDHNAKRVRPNREKIAQKGHQNSDGPTAETLSDPGHPDAEHDGARLEIGVHVQDETYRDRAIKGLAKTLFLSPSFSIPCSNFTKLARKLFPRSVVV